MDMTKSNLVRGKMEWHARALSTGEHSAVVLFHWKTSLGWWCEHFARPTVCSQ